MPTILSAAFIGLCSDYLSGGVMGVFSFSRTLAAYFLNVLARFLDLKKNIFIFLLILVSLFLSNLVAFVFHVLIFKLQDHGQPPAFPAAVHGHGRHDHPGIRKKRNPCWMYLSKRKLTPEYVKKAAVVSTVFLVVVFTGIFVAFWSIQILQQ